MGKKKPAPPPAPDYAAQAKAQGEANQQAAQQSAVLSNPNVYSPYGNQIVSYDATGPGGAIQPTIRQTLTPDAQAALNAQQAFERQSAELGQQGIQQASGILGSPFQYQGPGMQTSFNQGPNALTDLDLSGIAKMPINAGTTAQQAIMARLQPQLDRDAETLRTRLINQGMAAGGEGYNNEQTIFGQNKNDLLNQASLYGIGLDMQANQQGFDQALQRGGFYNQGVAQNYNQARGAAEFGNNAVGLSLQHQLALRNQPLNELTALMAGSQIQAPQFQQYQGQSIGAAPIFDASRAQGQYNTDIYGQQMAGYNAQMGALGSALGGLTGMATQPTMGLFGKKLWG